MPNRFGDEAIVQPTSANRFGDAPASPASSAPTAPAPTIAPIPEPKGIGENISRWAENVSHDLKYGTDLTGVGSVLKKMGAHGLDVGNSDKVGEFMGSLPLGILRATKGVGELPSQTWQGTKDIVGGAAQAATMPSMLAGPEGEATTGALKAATEVPAAIVKGAGKVADLIPNAERAGEGFSKVMGAARFLPVDVTAPGNIALQTKDLADAGGRTSKVISDFLKRVTNPDKGPLTYEEARAFYSNASRLSADESMKLTPVMKRQIGMFTDALNTSLEGAAQQVGKLTDYQKAMTEYHNAMRLKALGQGAKDVLTSTAAKGVAAAGAGAAGAYAVREFLK